MDTEEFSEMVLLQNYQSELELLERIRFSPGYPPSVKHQESSIKFLYRPVIDVSTLQNWLAYTKSRDSEFKSTTQCMFQNDVGQVKDVGTLKMNSSYPNCDGSIRLTLGVFKFLMDKVPECKLQASVNGIIEGGTFPNSLNFRVEIGNGSIGTASNPIWYNVVPWNDSRAAVYIINVSDVSPGFFEPGFTPYNQSRLTIKLRWSNQ